MSGASSNIKGPQSFQFDDANRKRAEAIVAKYPAGRQASAVLPLLDLAQRQSGNWLPAAAIEAVAELLSMPVIKVYEVATFYSMFNLQPVGRHFVQICTTTPCWLRGSDQIVKACRERLGVGPGETTTDQAFTVKEVECLGACVNAPMVQINDDFYEDLSPEIMRSVLDELAAGRLPPIGSQTGRRGSQAQSGPTSLKDKDKDKVTRDA